MADPDIDQFAREAVITTRGIVERSESIAYVVRDGDGDWQFLPARAVTEQDASVVSLADVVAIDPSVTNALGIPVGSIAERVGAQDWVVSQLK